MIQDVLTAISTVGFPIVCAGAMFWYVVKSQSKSDQIIADNTKVLVELTTLINEMHNHMIIKDKED